jgi:hypothetical protein
MRTRMLKSIAVTRGRALRAAAPRFRSSSTATIAPGTVRHKAISCNTGVYAFRRSLA